MFNILLCKGKTTHLQYKFFAVTIKHIAKVVIFCQQKRTIITAVACKIFCRKTNKKSTKKLYLQSRNNKKFSSLFYFFSFVLLCILLYIFLFYFSLRVSINIYLHAHVSNLARMISIGKLLLEF